MRKAFSLVLATAIVCLVGMAREAGATVTFSLVWEATTGLGITGTNAIAASAGDTLTLAIRMTTDQTVGAHGVSLNFDTDLGNELDLASPNGGKNWSGTTYGAPPTTYSELVPVGPGQLGVTESTGSSAGRINTFNGGVEMGGKIFLPTGTYTIGTARFVSNGGTTDGADVFVGLFNVGVDDVLNNLWLVIPPSDLVFGSASVISNPEPGTAALLGLGLVGIVLVARRSRRS